MVHLSYPDVPLYANRDEMTELICNASLSSTVMDSQEMININFTWFDFNGSIILNSPRISILYPMESISVLSLLPLSVLDTTISCEAIAVADNLHYIQASPAVLATGFLTIHGEFIYTYTICL